MDRLSSLLDLFSPKAQQVELISGKQSGLLLPGDSAIGLINDGDGFINQGLGQVNPNQQDRTRIKRGDLIWVTQGSHQQLFSDDDQFQLLCCPLCFGPVRLNPLFDMLPPVVRILQDDPARHALNPVIQLLLQESRQNRCGQETVLNRLAEVLLVHVLRFLMEHQKIEKGVLAGLSDLRLARAITAMHRQPEQRWSVESLAAEAGMSRTAFNQHFRDTVGCPPGEYLSQWRMRLACRMLETNKLSISQIVDQLGYLSETAFFRAFRRQIGVSPGKYRMQATA
ncbi:AraC family transcriptional regulator [Motiliproteus sp. MSK22-1]|uniref:AraC family transcriptional regulator n=1 Tax=Motiliproteus sp. MSK22-1 TaxID=1897630 RepID=UPI0013010A8F|nr:AraC family transcriptional regulator [Motiliproteus sp. MSK22-1]